MGFKSFFPLPLFIILLSASFNTYAQEGNFLFSAADSLGQQPAQERVYLHLDKPNYSFGDTIWYKAYTVIGQRHQLSALSGVLYVELISPKDSLVTRQTVALISGIGWSDIPLPHTLKQGVYRIRAYTRWMLNMGSEYFYDQKIMVGGIAPEVNKQAEKGHLDVQFFPEGGELVNGVRSRVAIKAVRVNGLGENIKGTIEDNVGNVVADFATQHLGMGVFALIPEAGKNYKARISSDGEASFTIDLPKAQEMGYTLALNNNGKDSIYIKVVTNEQTLTRDKDQPFYIIAQSNGKVYYTTQGKLENLAYTAKVEKDRFPEGIAQFTLFSQAGEPLAERVVFVDDVKSECQLNLSTPNKTYTTRDKIVLSLTAKTDSNRAVTGSFSVAVINESKVQIDENAENTILNNLLLTSELKGYIEQPNYYFANRNEQAKADLDVLMLTQGYTRYDWKQILYSKLKKITYPMERTLELGGNLTTPAGKPIANGSVTLVATKQNLLRDTITNAEGKFRFTNLYLTDTAMVILRARKANNGSNVKITTTLADYSKMFPIKNTSNEIIMDTAKVKQHFNDYQKEQKQDFVKNGKRLNTVTIKGFKRSEKPDFSRSSNLHGGGNADRIVMGKDLGYCANLSECLANKLIGIPGYKEMSVIVDGINLGVGHIDDINPNDVYSIEVLYHSFAKAIYGSSIVKGGALIITLKNAGEGGVDYSKVQPAGLMVLPYIGFYKAKAFYTPKYEHKADSQPDSRTTIYWNPNIITDKNGKAAIEYFNNDTKGSYRVVVEGIDEDGKLGRAVYHYTVE